MYFLYNSSDVGCAVRWRKLDDIMREIKSGVEQFNIGEIQFEDDTITARKKFNRSL